MGDYQRAYIETSEVLILIFIFIIFPLIKIKSFMETKNSFYSTIFDVSKQIQFKPKGKYRSINEKILLKTRFLPSMKGSDEKIFTETNYYDSLDAGKEDQNCVDDPKRVDD